MPTVDASVGLLDDQGNRVGGSAAPLRIDPTGTTTQPVAGTGTAGTPATGIVTVQGIASGTVVPIIDPDTTGSTGALAALNSSVTVATAGQNSVSMQLAAGTFVGTIVPEASQDGGTDWQAAIFEDPVTGAFAASVSFGGVNTLTLKSILIPRGATNVRVRVSVSISGSANCTLRAVAAQGSFLLAKLTDGTNIAGVAPASTAPVATQPAEVVVLSPNQQTIPVNIATAAGLTNGIAIGKVTNGAGSTGVVLPIRNTTYTEQTTNFTGSVKSASANDTSAGTGARTIKITYYDQTVAGPNTENATLNGTTAVNLVNTNHCFIEKIEVLTVGSGATNAGIISLFTATGGTGTTVATVTTGSGTDGRTYYAHHYIPSGKTTSITGFNCGTVGNQSAEAFLKSKDPTNANSYEEQISDSLAVGANTTSTVKLFNSPLKVAGPARVTLYQIPNGNATQFYGTFEYQE